MIIPIRDINRLCTTARSRLAARGAVIDRLSVYHEVIRIYGEVRHMDAAALRRPIAASVEDSHDTVHVTAGSDPSPSHITIDGRTVIAAEAAPASLHVPPAGHTAADAGALPPVPPAVGTGDGQRDR